ncbi:MAG: molecular chaperone [Sphingomonas sp.]|nr:molecular chaperone [Sphingomonas sp.]
MALYRLAAPAALFASLLIAAPAADAGVGDLLVAPTRVVLNGSRGTEIILNNIGDDVATYRVSVELRRMTPDGMLHDVADPNAEEQLAQSMIMYAPRRVTLPPREPQTIRISARAPKDLPDGEYRVHLLFRAVPPPTPVEAPKDVKGIAFKLTTIYGVTIPVIARFGNLEATAGIANVKRTSEDGKPAISLQLTRKGDRSTFGEIRVMKAGIKDPIAVQRGIAIYTEIGQRNVTIPVDEKYSSAANGRVTVQYVEPSDNGPLTIAESDAVLN